MFGKLFIGLFELCYDAVLTHGRDALLAFVLFIAMMIQRSSITIAVNRRWKRRLKYHLPDLVKEELLERETEIQRLSETLHRLRQDHDTLKACVRGSTNFYDQAKAMLDQPEIMRIRKEKDA